MNDRFAHGLQLGQMGCVESVKFDLICHKMCVSLTLEKFESNRKWV